MHGSFLSLLDDEEHKEKIREFLNDVESLSGTLFKQPDATPTDLPEQASEPVVGHVSPVKQEVTVRVAPATYPQVVESTPLDMRAAVATALAHLATLEQYMTSRHLTCHLEAAQKALNSIKL